MQQVQELDELKYQAPLPAKIDQIRNLGLVLLQDYHIQLDGREAWQQGMESDFITRLLESEPRLKEGRALAEAQAVTAMMDNSDGLALSLSDQAEVSRVGFVVQEEEALPVAEGLVEMVGHEKALEMAMSAGGDFELVFTVRPEGLEAARLACGLTMIGEVVEEGIWMEKGDERRRVEARGYEHRIGIQYAKIEGFK